MGTGVLGWSPETFWKSTVHDLTAALDGYVIKKGGKKGRLSDQEYDELIEMLNEG